MDVDRFVQHYEQNVLYFRSADREFIKWWVSSALEGFGPNTYGSFVCPVTNTKALISRDGNRLYVFVKLSGITPEGNDADKAAAAFLKLHNYTGFERAAIGLRMPIGVIKYVGEPTVGQAIWQWIIGFVGSIFGKTVMSRPVECVEVKEKKVEKLSPINPYVDLADYIVKTRKKGTVYLFCGDMFCPFDGYRNLLPGEIVWFRGESTVRVVTPNHTLATLPISSTMQVALRRVAEIENWLEEIKGQDYAI